MFRSDVHVINGESMRGIVHVSSYLSGQGKPKWVKEASSIKKKARNY